MRGVAADVAKTAALSPPRAWATLSGPDRRSDAPRTHDGKEAGMKRRDFLKHGTTAGAAAGGPGVPALPTAADVNTGWNSDEGRGARCQRYLFHVEGCNTMYTKTIGRWQERNFKLKGARWYFLTADYAFGHDLYRVSSKFLAEHGGVNLGNDMVPT